MWNRSPRAESEIFNTSEFEDTFVVEKEELEDHNTFLYQILSEQCNKRSGDKVSEWDRVVGL